MSSGRWSPANPPVHVIPRSLKSLWHSDVILGASVGAVTSGVLVVLALVLAPMLSGFTERPNTSVPGGVATVPPSAQGLAGARGDEGSARDEDGPTVTRREDTSSLPSASSPSSDKGARKPSSSGDDADAPLAPQTTIKPVPVKPSAAAGGGATPGPGQALTPSPVRSAMRLRVKAASFGRENGDPQLKLTMGVTTPTPAPGAPAGAAVPEQVTVSLRPEIPSHPEREATPLALQAHVDVVDGPAETSTTMGLRVRMSLAPATADLPTIDESGEGDGKSNVVKLAIPLTAFADPGDDEAIPGVPQLPAETPTDGKPGEEPSNGDGEGKPTETPVEETPGTPVGLPAPDPAPSEPTTPAPSEPSAPAPSEPSAPSEPTTPAPSDPSTPSEPAPSEPPAAEMPMTEIQVPLIVTPEPITTVEKTVLPLPPEVDPDATPADGLRVTVAIQNALTDVVAGDEATPTDPPATGDPAAPADPATPADPVTPADPAPTTDPAPSTEPSSDGYGAGHPQLISDSTSG
jgi:hypothetical protein